MTADARLQRRSRLAAVLALAAIAAAGCAAVEAQRRSPGVMAEGEFRPTRPAAANYGPDPSRTCPTGGAFQVMGSYLADIAKDTGRPAAQPDGRLCAAADTFLGWDSPDLPPESVVRTISAYFGLPAPPTRVVITNLESDEPRQVAQRASEVVGNFNGAEPRYGMAVQRIQSGARSRTSSDQQIPGKTKLVLLVEDLPLDLQPVPRQVPAGGKATVAGKLVGGRTNAKVLYCDTTGKLVQSPDQQGDAFSVEVACGDRPGLVPVEIRGEKNGAATSLARFSIACGTEAPKGAKVAPVAAGAPPPDAAQVARTLFERINAERSALGIPALAWDDAVAEVARGASQSYRAESLGGPGAGFDVAAALKKADVATVDVLQSPVAAPTAQEADALISSSPVNRANLLNRNVTHVGVGVVPAKDPNGATILFVTELFVKELPPVDPAALKAKLREAVDQRRAEARATPLASDPILDDVAQKYAAALAAGKGELPKDQESAIVAPLYKSFRTVNIVGGARGDPLELAQQPGIVAQAKVVGIGVASGANAVLGKNAPYVIIITGTRR